MENLIIAGKEDIPSILCDAEKGIIEIKGKCIPENPKEEIYVPIINWLNDYGSSPKPNTVVNIHLDYFNTGSSKCLRDIFLVFEDMHIRNISLITINWHYETDDEDMLQDGLDYQDKFQMIFNMIEIS